MTTQMEIDAFRSENVDEESNWLVRMDEHIDANTGNPFDLMIEGGRFPVAPGKTVYVFVRHGPTVRDWIDNGDQVVKVQIKAWVTPEGAHQLWDLTMKAQLLTRLPNNASLFGLRSHAMIDTEIKQRARIYP